MGVKQVEYTAFIHASGFMIDTKQAGELLGTSHNSKYCKCRICMEMNMARFSSLSAVRRVLADYIVNIMNTPVVTTSF
jgi:hypothetical protein